MRTSVDTSTTMETPATPELSPGAVARASQPPMLPLKSSLPDELLIQVFTCECWYSGDLASAAVFKLAQTMWNAPHLRRLVWDLYVGLYIDSYAPLDIASDLDLESLLGWTALVPPEPGIHKLEIYTNVAGTTPVLACASALCAVREMSLVGPSTTSLVVIPHRSKHNR
ncbi:hypothetical protein EXIGLDRAFT_763968 [Exidia glandulosa HHB12029]|uniref:Uncharacterized protein n=1 Tax=Exidia glandulosa HHB12029 TaxID=1314781 RepID=A0A165LJA4_EXIGL|nr:hypothetical protein EXIGLDRAFT_763968 [Exidia glandulosa HHB12029]